MKLVVIIYDSGIDESLMDLLQELRVPGYTKVFDAHGEGGRGKKFNSPVFPGTNNVLYVALPDEQVAPTAQRVRALQSSFRLKPGISIYVMPMEEM